MAGKIQQATSTQVAARQGDDTMQDLVKRMEGEIAKALPSVITPERFTRIVLSALSTTPELAQTTKASFLGAMMTAAQLGVEPNTPLGQAYLIPYNNRKKGVKECQFQLGYKGLIDLAYRSGEITIIQAHTVYENDDFDYQLGLDPKLEHVPYAGTDKGQPIFFYGVFKTKDGGYGFEVMSMADVKKHRKLFSKASYGPWDTNFEEMAKKTVLKKALKYAPMKSDFARGVASDETTRNYDDTSNLPHILDIADETEYTEVEYEIDENVVNMADVDVEKSKKTTKK